MSPSPFTPVTELLLCHACGSAVMVGVEDDEDSWSTWRDAHRLPCRHVVYGVTYDDRRVAVLACGRP